MTYDGVIPPDAIIDMYGPGWVVASSKKTQGSKDIKDIYNAYLDKANSKAPALLTAMPPATREKLSRLVVMFQHSKNRFEKGLTDKDVEKNFNAVKDLGEKISAEA